MPLPPWGQSDIPRPPAFGPRNAVRVIGPGTLLLAVSLGSGDWLLGPVIAARHGAAFLWIALVAILLQSLLNTEMARYTLATGEPVWSGFMRTWPGPRFWGSAYIGLHWLQLVWPGWALAAGVTLAAIFLGRPPGPEDRDIAMLLGALVLGAAIATVLWGRGARLTLERLEPFVLVGVTLFLLAMSLAFVPAPVWSRLVRGLLGAGGPAGPAPDWALIAALAAYSGAGGTINATLTHWLRDKGWGMAGTVGGRPAVVAGRTLHLAHEGKLFPPTEDNLAKWAEWWRYARLHLGWAWAGGCVVAIAGPALLALHFVRPDADSAGLAAATFLARAIADAEGYPFWFVTLAVGAWILGSTQIGIVEGFARSVTDILCTASAPSPGAVGRRASVAYFTAVGCFALGSFAALGVADPLALVVIGANVAAVNLVLLSAHTLRINRTLLPAALRPPLWRQAGLVASCLFFGVLVALTASRPGRLLALLGIRTVAGPG